MHARLVGKTIFIFLCLLMLVASESIEEDNDSNSVRTSTSVERLWGMADTVAVMGKIFTYHIPSDAFSGRVVKYEVSSAGQSGLPSWLRFNQATSILEGVPLEGDVGQHYISVMAVGQDGDSAKDVFSIDVMPANHESRAMPLRLVSKGEDAQHCDKSQVTLRLVLSVDMDVVGEENKKLLALVQKMANYLKVDKDQLQLLPRNGQQLLDDSAVRAGPGNARTIRTPGAVLLWKISCEENLSPSGEEILSKIETDSREGTLAEILEVPVIGWHVVRRTSTLSRRFKRQLHLEYSTPLPELLPTRPAIFPGSYWETDPYPDEGFEDTEVQPPSRVIPTMASPIFTEPGYRHSHMHHSHRTKTQGRHHHPYHASVSPFNPYRDNNDAAAFRKENIIYGTPIPTLEIHPTATWDEYSRASPDDFSSPTELTDLFQPSRVTTPALPEVESTVTHDIPMPTVPAIPKQNTPPRRKKKLPRKSLPAGQYFEYRIPNDTFYDREDGLTRDLTLTMLTHDGQPIGPGMWLQFNSTSQTIYGTPTRHQIIRWEFIIVAFDKDGLSVNETIQLTVDQHRTDRKVNHEFILEVEHDRYTMPTLVMRNMELMKRLGILFGEIREDAVGYNLKDLKMIVRDFSPTSFSWYNTSVVNSSACDQGTIEKQFHMLVVPDKRKISDRLLELLSPDFTYGPALPKVSLVYHGACLEYVTTLPTKVTHENTRPRVVNQINMINATAGRPLNYRIPEDTFYDDDQGSTSKLTLELLDEHSGQLLPSSWVTLDSTRMMIAGLPMMADSKGKDSNHRDYHYVLRAMDYQRATATESFAIRVYRNETFSPPVEFSLELKWDYHTFISSLKNKMMLVDLLVSLYADKDSSHIHVQDITEGSVVFTWTNISLPSKPCPREQIAELMKFLVTEDGSATVNLTETFSATEHNITKVTIMPLGYCQSDMTPTSVLIGPPTTTLAPRQATSEDDVLISTIVPAIVIAAMLLIAAIVACILYRKKRKGKMTMEDASTFVKRGAPVIFTHELEEKPDSAKHPMIMKEEKPPLPPPEYPRTSSGSSSPSTPPPPHGGGRADHRGGSNRRSKSPYHHPQHPAPTLERQQAPQQTESSPLYQPPPPVTANRDNRMHWPNKHALTYRMPPPYVPP